MIPISWWACSQLGATNGGGHGIGELPMTLRSLRCRISSKPVSLCA
jgi:hypothetical protein